MTAQPSNINIGSLQGPHGAQQVQSVTTVSKSKGVSSTASYGNASATPSSGASVVSEAASLSLSAEGVQRLKSAERVKISSTEDAKSLMNDIAESIKNNTEAARTVHSSLRIMKINQLIYD